MSTYVVPQTLVFQEFQAIPSAITEPLRATLIGPNYQLVKTASKGALGTYDPNSETCYSWPNRTAGAVVDQDWTRVFIDDALLQYFYNAASGADTIKATYCSVVDLVGDSAVKTAIRASATNWKTYGSYARAAVLRNRDVQLGDVAKVSAVVDGTTYTLWSYIAGFMNDKIDGVVGNAVEDPNNESAPLDASSSITPSIVYNKIGYAGNSVDITAAATPPNVPEQGYIDGVQADEYTLEVIQGGDYDETLIQVTSASGTDDVASLTPSNWGVATAFGNKSLSVTFTRVGADVFVDGMKWELTVNFGATDVDPVSGGTYSGPSDTTYIITVSTGGEFGGASGNPEITVSTATGIDSSGPHEVAALDTAIEIGAYGVTVEFTSNIGAGQGLYAGDRYYIPVTAPSSGAVKTLVLAHSLPDELIGLDDEGVCGAPPSLAVTLYIKKDIEVTKNRTGFAPLVNWTTSATEICLADGILSYDATWVDDSGTMLPLSVKSGDAWVYYRALLQTGTTTVGEISDSADIPAIFGTAPDADNPMSMAALFALLNANGTAVKYINVASDDATGYSAALSVLSQRDDVYSLVPLTFNTTIQGLVQAHVNSMSTPTTGRWRRAIFSSLVLDEKAIVDSSDNGGSAVLATILDDPGTSGTQYTLVEVTSDVDLLTLGVAAGDILRTLYTTDGFGNSTYSEFTVDAVLSEDSLRLVSGPSAPVSIASKIEIWRNLEGDAYAAEIAATNAAFADRRVTNIWPDYFEYGTDELAGYYLAAAVAGLRSGVVPQRSLTNTALAGPDSVEKTTDMFSDTQLNTIAAGGTLVVTKSSEGTVYIRHNLTTDMTDINTKEEMVTANVDAICYFLLQTIAPYTGISNLTDETINQIHVELDDAIEFMRNNSELITVGGQLISGTVTSIAQHPTLQDRLVVVLSLDIPYPVNNTEIHLVI